MTKDEAAKFLRQLAKWLVNSQVGASHWPEQLDEVIAALSSPCACGEPLTRGWMFGAWDWCDGDTGMRHIPIYTSDNRPNGCKPVIILADEPQDAV